MNLKSLTRKVNLYYRITVLANTASVLQKLDELETYNARKEYAEDHLEHLSSGSSRLVYLTDDNTVVKLAKNDKGVEQNKVESRPMNSRFINKIISKSPNCIWIETQYLKKITVDEFKKMAGVDFSNFCDIILYMLKDVADIEATKPKTFDEFKDCEILQEMKRLGEKYKLMPGDMVRISSWGKTKDDQLVLMDAGLNRHLYDSLYE